MLHLAPLDEATWDDSLANYADATLFHTSGWLTVLARTFGVQVERLGIFDGPRVQGLLPVLRRRRGPFVLMGSPIAGLGTPYLGPLVPEGLLDETFTLLETLVQREHAASVQVNFPGPVHFNTTPAGYQLDERITLVLQLANRTRDELWLGLKKNCRAHVRQAEKRGVEIFEAQDPSIFEDYFRLEREVFARRQRPVPFPRRFYYHLWETLHPIDAMNVFAARHEGRVIGVQINGWYRGKLWGLFGATDGASRQVYPGNLLEWHLIEWANAWGMEWYDMVDGMDAGWSEFKRGFGAQELLTPCLTADHSRAAALVRQTRHTVRRAIARLSASLPRVAAFAHLSGTSASVASSETSAVADS